MAPRYGRIYAGALKDPRLGGAELKALGVLALNAFRDLSNVRGKPAKFCADSGLTRSAWFRAIGRLEEFGYVQRRKEGRSVIHKVDPDNGPTDGTDKSPIHGTDKSAADGTVRAAIGPMAGTARVPAVGLSSPGHGTRPLIKDSFKDSLKDEEEASPSIDCADVFDDPRHRVAYLAYRAVHRMPDGFDAIVRSVHDPATGGARFDWPTIGGALLDMRGVAASFSPVALRGFCRKLAEAKRGPVPGGTSLEVDRSEWKSEHCEFCVATVGSVEGELRMGVIHAPGCPQKNGRPSAPARARSEQSGPTRIADVVAAVAAS